MAWTEECEGTEKNRDEGNIRQQQPRDTPGQCEGVPLSTLTRLADGLGPKELALPAFPRRTRPGHLGTLVPPLFPKEDSAAARGFAAAKTDASIPLIVFYHPHASCVNQHIWAISALGFRYRLPILDQAPVKPNPLALPPGLTDLLRRASALLQLEQRHRARQSRAKEAIGRLWPCHPLPMETPTEPPVPLCYQPESGPSKLARTAYGQHRG